jgi:hypothetical protein
MTSSHKRLGAKDYYLKIVTIFRAFNAVSWAAFNPNESWLEIYSPGGCAHMYKSDLALDQEYLVVWFGGESGHAGHMVDHSKPQNKRADI